MAETIFGKIARGEAQAQLVYQDERALAFHDINPGAPTHILVIPPTPLAGRAAAAEEDESLLGHLVLVARQIAADAGLEDFRVVINNGSGAGQTVFHLHLHVLGGRPLSWPPG